jgi:hypothetical protein
MLVVQVLFKHVVDTLSAVSRDDLTVPQLAAFKICQRVTSLSFKQVFFPWIFAYLVAYTIQGSPDAWDSHSRVVRFGQRLQQFGVENEWDMV